ncbi:MAG: DEAD/DEAH box helicase [Clostridia bacterium]
MTFEEMNLIAPLLAAVKKSGYSEPTPIQQETIPLVLAGEDVLGCAQTGTGKTAAFALPILQLLSKDGSTRTRASLRPIRALILTPTRELAQQIYENFTQYGAKLGLSACVVYGGVKQYSQTERLRRGVDVLIATPGRLNDLIGQGYIRLDRLEVFVLDEADRMLDMGFIHDVKKVLGLIPRERQTLMFSATMPREVESLAMGILHSPKTVKVDPVTSTVDSIHQSLYYVDKINKRFLLAQLLNKPEVENALVFTRTRYGADRVVSELARENIASRAIHGDKSQAARQEALNMFKTGKIKVLIATDIAARGIDIVGLSHVINYDLPNEPEGYIHRIGRTGRAGLEGDAISFCCVDEVKALSAIEKLIGKRIPVLPCDWPMTIMIPTEKKPQDSRPPRRDFPRKLAMDGSPLRQSTSYAPYPPKAVAARRKPYGASAPARSSGGYDRSERASSYDRAGSSYDRSGSGYDRAGSSYDRPATGHDRPASGHGPSHGGPYGQPAPRSGAPRTGAPRRKPY